MSLGLSVWRWRALVYARRKQKQVRQGRVERGQKQKREIHGNSIEFWSEVGGLTNKRHQVEG